MVSSFQMDSTKSVRIKYNTIQKSPSKHKEDDNFLQKINRDTE